ncbi:class I SAM-dependent methyltransferase [uncultured Aquimarina sp.]|uniref:class I SAM-dependent methyltransferase n=1 Tax=uncultured Aquimarina sp. TaxID=575652 RepID=UPI00261927C5|nr:class I SAM-dependent methyltransferase [uncultured Aquimarina sp.]
MKDFWNNRYKIEDSAYGYEPNEFFKEELAKVKSGKILLPAEGEGRNAIFAAKLGWEVSAFDMSEQGKIKAEKLAEKSKVSIEYAVGEFEELEYQKEHFDTIGLIYAHFTAESKSKYHKTLDKYLKKGGRIIFEAFSKSNLEFNAKNLNSNGPKDIKALFSVDEIKNDFYNYEIIELKEEILELNEGLYHSGLSAIIRFVGIKK